jgi:DHA2 family multidrug resistance protein-like MFS transporter
MATLAVLAAMAMVVLDAGLINVALPTVAGAFGVAPATAILAVGAYQLAIVIGLLPAAHLAERLGYRRLFVVGLATFTGASALCAAAPDFPLLVTARFLQGLGGSAILALGIALLRATLGRERLGSAIGWNALNVALCAAAGPTVGGLILSVADWHWLFLVNLPIGGLAMIAARSLPHVVATREDSDWRAILAFVLGAALMFLAFAASATAPWLAGGLACVSVMSIAWLVRRDRHKATPLIPVDLLAERPFRLAVAASVCCFVGQSAGQLAIPFYLQLELSQSALSTGLILALWPASVAVTSPWANRLVVRFGSGALCIAGGSILGLGLLGASFLPARGSLTPLAASAMLCGVGFGLFQVPNNRNLFLAVPAERSAAAGGMQGTARLTGQATGAMLLSLVFASSPGLASPRLALGLAAAFALAAALISAFREGRTPMPVFGEING